MLALRVLLGAVILTLGRRLFWLFVGALGFVTALRLAAQFFRGQPEWLTIVVAILAGAVGAVLAVLLQRLAIAVAGFLAGVYLAIVILDLVNVDIQAWSFILFLVAGVIGAVLLFVLFDWALIVVSSLVGAGMIAQPLELPTMITLLTFAGLFVLGIVVQAGLMRRERGGVVPPEPAEPEPSEQD